MRRSSTRWNAIGLTLVVCTLWTLLSTAAAAPCTITVRPGQSIQAAIDRAPAGAVICLAAGTWSEEILISKSLTLRGQTNGQSIIKRPMHGDALWIGTPFQESVVAVIEQLVVVGSGETSGSSRMMDLGGGVFVGGSAHTSISSCDLSLGAFGIMIAGSAQTVITSSAIHDNEVSGISASSSSSVTIEDCAISRNKFGIVVGDDASARVASCSVVESQLDGLLLLGSSETVVENSTIARGRIAYGIQTAGSGQVTVRDCDISGNGMPGIASRDSSRATIEDCTISGNMDGIMLFDHASASIIANRILGSRQCGVSWFSGFAGHITGKGNEIPGPNDPDGNKEAAVWPSTLQFLLTSEGGEL